MQLLLNSILQTILAAPTLLDASASAQTARRLSETTVNRYEAISFFLLLLLLAAVAVYFLWNRAAKDFSQVPRLSFLHALGVTLAWGSLCVTVMTMVAATRETMMPGTWPNIGLLYSVPTKTLVDAEKKDEKLPQRELQLASFRSALWQYAASHQGKFPSTSDSSLPAELRSTPSAKDANFVYAAGLSLRKTNEPLVIEPAGGGLTRLALRTNGEISPLNAEEAEQFKGAKQ